MRLDEHDPGIRTSLWRAGPVDIRLHWQAPMTLLAVDIVPLGSVAPDEPPLPLRLLACEVLMQRLGLDDPLLEALMSQRLELRQRLAESVTLKDDRPAEPGGVIIDLMTRITT